MATRSESSETGDLRLAVEREYEGQSVRITYRDPQPLFLPGETVVVGPDAEVELPDGVDLAVKRMESAEDLFDSETVRKLNDAGLDRPYRRTGPPDTWVVHDPSMLVLGAALTGFALWNPSFPVLTVPLRLLSIIFEMSANQFFIQPLGLLGGPIAAPSWLGSVVFVLLGFCFILLAFIDPEGMG